MVGGQLFHIIQESCVAHVPLKEPFLLPLENIEIITPRCVFGNYHVCHMTRNFPTCPSSSPTNEKKQKNKKTRQRPPPQQQQQQRRK